MNKLIKTVYINIGVAFFLALFFLPIVMNAAGGPELNPGSSQNIKLENPFKCSGSDCTLLGLIASILNNIVMPIAAVLVVIFIILAGFKYVQAQGNPKEIQDANRNLLWALIGAGVLLSAAGISKVIENTVTSLLN